jgi:hypothetical protein
MCIHYVYGEIDGFWIFLREETADTLVRLWESLEEAKTWGQLRKYVGNQMFAVLLRVARLPAAPADHTAFDCVPVFQRFADEWTMDTLIEIMLGQLPYMDSLKPNEETFDLVKKFFATSTDAESRTVLQLAGHGYRADRDDDKIAECLAGPVCAAKR